MATFTVTTTADRVDAGDGVLSLREAVGRANAAAGADTILFANAVEGQRLVLTQGQLTLSGDARIDGDRDGNGSRVTLDGNDNGRVLQVAGEGTDARLADLTLANGRVLDGDGGGALLTAGNRLTLDGCVVRGSYITAGHTGAGVFAAPGSSLRVIDSAIVDNRAFVADGGGLGARGAAVTVRGSDISGNYVTNDGGGISATDGSSLTIEATTLSSNGASFSRGAGSGGAISVDDSRADITRSTIDGNRAGIGGGVFADDSTVSLSASTLSGNQAAVFFGGEGEYNGEGGAVWARGGTVALSSSTVTGNTAFVVSPEAAGGGIHAEAATGLAIADSIVAGNFAAPYRPDAGPARRAADINGVITASNGHNIFGSAVVGEGEGDREGVAAARVFAALDPETGGGRLALNGGPTETVRLRDALDNPALSGADPLDAGPTDQRGVERPLPDNSNPDIGSFELNQAALSTRASPNNDVLTGSASPDTITALAGNDLVRGLAGNDRLRGGRGSDTFDGGDGNDVLDGSVGRDLLRGAGGDDLLFGGSGGDRLSGGFGGDLLDGQGGVDTLLGDAGRDRFDFDPGDSSVGAGRRDLIQDFAAGVDRIDLRSIDARGGVAGDQAFRFVGDDPLAGGGQLRFTFAGTSTVVQGSTDADAAPEFEVQLAGRIVLGADDFLL